MSAVADLRNGSLSRWRVEWWRLTRTRRLLVLPMVFVGLGLAEPLGTKYLSTLLNASTRKQKITIIMPPPTPADGIAAYAGNAMLIGLIVSVVVAALACTVDDKPALSVFYRTRATSYRALLLPRVTVTAAAVVGGHLLGLACAWYETAVLIGRPDSRALILDGLLASLYLVFVVCVTALAATLASGTLGTVGGTLVALLALPLLGRIPWLTQWMPSLLSSAAGPLFEHTGAGHFGRAVAATVGLGAACLAGAVWQGARREAG